MQYFRNVDLTKLYPVSESAIRKWIDAARRGKLDLTLYEQGGRTYIANTQKNLAAIKQLVERRRKFVNKRGHQFVKPLSDFYEQYNEAQILDIMANLAAHRELPSQYGYFDGGADDWDTYANRLLTVDTPNTLKSTIELIDTSLDSLDRLLKGRKKVNVVDLGVGNALPVRGLLTHLIERGVLNRYIALDISAGMLEIARRNVKEWFGDRVPFEAHVRDITQDHFKDLIARDYLGDSAGTPLNLALLLGGTLSNFRQPDDVLRIINTSMMPGDLLMNSLKLDTPHSRMHFDFSIGPDKTVPDWRNIFKLLGIDESCYEVEGVFDRDLKARLIRVRLKTALTIQFDVGGVARSIELNKGETILILRIWHRNALDTVGQLTRNGFDLLLANQTTDHEYLLTVSDVSASTRGS